MPPMSTYSFRHIYTGRVCIGEGYSWIEAKGDAAEILGVSPLSLELILDTKESTVTTTEAKLKAHLGHYLISSVAKGTHRDRAGYIVDVILPEYGISLDLPEPVTPSELTQAAAFLGKNVLVKQGGNIVGAGQVVLVSRGLGARPALAVAPFQGGEAGKYVYGERYTFIEIDNA